jgi:hypothetical protein
VKFVRQFATTRAATWLWSAPPLNSARAKPHTHKKTNQLQLARRRSVCCAARKPLGFHTPAEPATFDPTPIKDRGTLVLRNSFGTARASTWLWWWSALPQRARSHQNNTPNQQLLASPPSTGPSHRTQAPGLPHACRAGHVRPYPYERAPRFGLSDIRSLQPVLRRGCGCGCQLRSARAKPPKQDTYLVHET